MFFFLRSKIREKTAKFNSSAPRQKFKILVCRILGKELLCLMHQFFLFSIKTEEGDIKVTARQTSI